MNSNVISQFEKLVSKNQQDLDNAIKNKLTDEQRKQSFKLRTNKRVLSIIKKYPEELTINNYKELGDLNGIGKGTITKLQNIFEKGYIDELKGYTAPKNNKEDIIKNLEEVINIGRSTAKELVESGVKSVDDLKKKVNTKKIEVNSKILLGLKYYQKIQERIPRNHITEINEFIKNRINFLNKKEKLTAENKYIFKICGSYRRNKPTSGDIDILITQKNTSKTSKYLDEHLPKIIQMFKQPWKGNNFKPFLIDNLTDITPTKYMGFAQFKNNLPFRIDIRFVSYDSFYTALLYFTGSDEFNKVMRNIAKDKGYKLSEYGLFKIDSKNQVPIKSEEHVFKILNMDYLEPHLR
ncbi:putative family X DNA polymerase [Cafeteria roenbergensis virus]|uniref:Putative family X DNA polymerase n=1 Tax=Cafeteria roenbergensis virus (strain BV-PW1) TaxID=693272 RepID=E3T5M9_CROVB|nr:putative family X DNA polymerase [Cafeteria roenbergensis virus BV-PW1]ADO67492.1 putative family X DNA polymerase [Cafeteria roenbergensis virus BV-PW1]